MLTNTQRMNLINRLQVLQQEIAQVAQTLIDNPCPLSDEELDKAAESLLKNNGVLKLISLEKQLEKGMDESILATYHPHAKNNTMRAYNSATDSQMLTLFQRLIETNRYEVAEGDKDATAFCIRITMGNQAVTPPPKTEPDAEETAPAKSSGSFWTIVVTEEEPVKPILKIGPKKVVRQKVDGETLEQHLEMCGMSRIAFEQQITEVREKMSPEAVYWVHMTESKTRH